MSIYRLTMWLMLLCKLIVIFFSGASTIYGINIDGYESTYLAYTRGFSVDAPELRSQISFSTTLFGVVNASYTQRFRWEINESSAPIRDFDFNPSLYAELKEKEVLVRFGYEHESNGQDEERSRSWERVFLMKKISSAGMFFSMKGWIPFFLHENNGIVDYQGKGEASVGYDNGKVKVSLTSRVKSSRVEASYNVGDFYIYLQSFNGFGPQIIEFDKDNHLNMIGIAITN